MIEKTPLTRVFSSLALQILGADSFLCRGNVLCLVKYATAALASTQEVTVGSPLTSRHCQMSSGAKPLSLHTVYLSNFIPLLWFNSSLHRDGSYTWIFLSRRPVSQFLLMCLCLDTFLLLEQLRLKLSPLPPPHCYHYWLFWVPRQQVLP